MPDSDPIGALNAANDPEAMQRFELIVTLFRASLAPWLNQDIDRIAENQAAIISACAAFAGMTVGHMTFVGAMEPRDHKRAGKVVAINFKNGIKMGLAEARRAAQAGGQMQ